MFLASRSLNKALPLVALAMVPIGFALYLQDTHPFSQTLASRHIDLDAYKSDNRLNFATAARQLDGQIIRPGESFSFNRCVGPRTVKRGFVPARGFVGNEVLSTEGGGICLVSSMLYQAALLSGLEVTSRTPHGKRVASVPPGLDATVWYGQTDLIVNNPYDRPVQIIARTRGDDTGKADLEIGFAGDKDLGQRVAAAGYRLDRREIGRRGDTLLVEVQLASRNRDKTISRDKYKL